MATYADNNVGVCAIEVYFPSTYVTQEDLEAANSVSKGKYTIGLGQDAMAFTGDREDINSVCLTVVQSLLEKYSISPRDIGRLEVGTESLVDKSKSTKTVLMSLFAESGNSDIEGATVVNACYGGTAALLNALTWCDSSAWDGRYAIVVAGDIAVYADGPARPTGGCGAVALLVGRNAPLSINLRTRSTCASHVWDFFKPKMNSEYPEVDGALSETCFLKSLDDCYSKFIERQAKFNGNSGKLGIPGTHHFLFHSPYNKLVQKSLARVYYQDVRASRVDCPDELARWKSCDIESTYKDKDLETRLKEASASAYSEKVASSCVASKLIGNTYTAAVWMNLACLVATHGASLDGKQVTLFSYGSGAIATMMEIRPVAAPAGSAFTLERIQRALNLFARLESREQLTPSALTHALNARERLHHICPFQPNYVIDPLFPGTFYLQEITTSYERIYQRKSPDSARELGRLSYRTDETLDSNDLSLELSNQLDIEGTDFWMHSEAQAARLRGGSEESTADGETIGGLGLHLGDDNKSSLRKSKTFVWASGRPNVKVVVTGVAAALPGRNSAVFAPNVNNVHRIIRGENCITPIPDVIKDAMLEKNIILLKKNKDGSQTKTPVSTHEENINLCASLGDFSLTAYGVPESIAMTMDLSVQVAVAAGLEALKDAGIVTGEGEGLSGWELPASMQDTTGVVYATSFPALDTAIAEVSKYFKSKSTSQEHIPLVVSALRERLEAVVGTLSPASEAALAEIEKLAQEVTADNPKVKPYEFDRKFLFRVLVLGNAQLAQIIKAKGPNMQTNAACAGSTQAVALAYDMIQVGRAERMVVVAGDNAASDTLMPWLGNGFRALGAATICAVVEEASIPFDKRRSGMILGAGGIGMVLESEQGALRRHAIAQSLHPPESLVRQRPPFKCRLLGTLISNSAYHGASLDRNHIASEMERFIASVEKEQGISRREIARHGVYFSHETSTYSSPTSSCASNEIHGLRKVFGEDLQHLLILNTKGFTGHPMGVSFEDVVAAEVLVSGQVPPIANFVEGSTDANLGSDIKLSRGGSYPCKYAIRFAAGFGSQIALAVYGAAYL